MPAVAIELNDEGIRVSAGTAVSPGYALIDGHGLLTGKDAQAIARLRPRQLHNRFWCELDSAPIGAPFGAGVTRADLAHTHLSHLWSAVPAGVDRAILVVPGSAGEQQLGLMLGLTRSLDIPVNGMVDAAVAAAATGTPGRRLLHVDLQLHRAVVTELSHEAELVRQRVQLSDATGIVALHDAWIRRIAEVFVRQTRFDPLHGGATEQALYDRLPDLLGVLREEQSALLEIEGGGRLHSVELLQRELLPAVRQAYDQLVQLVRLLARDGDPATLLVSHRVAAVPGLCSRLGEIGETAPVALPQRAALDGALLHERLICAEGETLPFITRLPRSVRDAGVEAPSTRPPEISPTRRAESPTHLLLAGRALPLTADPLKLGVAPAGRRTWPLTGRTAGVSRTHCSLRRDASDVIVEDHSTHGTFVNDRRIDGSAVLVAGDRLRLGTPGIELSLIRVEEDDGAPQD